MDNPWVRGGIGAVLITLVYTILLAWVAGIFAPWISEKLA
jgi:hypothetical protein